MEESLETLLSQKCNIHPLSSNTTLMRWLVFFIMTLCFSCVTVGQTAFRDFLKSEFCEENLDFWLACQEFKTCDSPEELTRRAARIYEEFISDESPRQVSIRTCVQRYVLKSKYKLGIRKMFLFFAHEYSMQFNVWEQEQGCVLRKLQPSIMHLFYINHSN